jgi:hypothetical protein
MFIDEKTGVTIHADLDETVSRATLRSYDLVQAFLPVLRETAEYVQLLPLFPAYAMEDSDSDWWDGEDCSYLVNENLFDTLNLYAPEGYYFGCTEGDGSDFGYWKYDDEDNDEIMFHGSPASQIFF